MTRKTPESYYSVDPVRPAPLGKAEECELFRQYHQRRTRERRERIVRQYLYWAAEIARRYAGPRLALPDAISAANLGLMRAIEGYDPASGHRFVTFSFFAIRRHVLSALAQTYVVNPRAAVDEAKRLNPGRESEAVRETYDRIGSPQPINTVSETTDAAEKDERETSDRDMLLEHLKGRIGKLPKTERRVMVLRYFTLPGDVMGFQEIADKLRLPGQHTVARIHARVVRQLHDELEKELE